MEEMEYESPDWALDAECTRHPDEVFIYNGEASRPLLEQAAKICGSCVAKNRCLEEADKADLFWGVRGGRLPDALTGSRVPPREGGGKPTKGCARGHYGHWTWNRSKSSWFCGQCERLRQTVGLEPLPKNHFCKRGHDKRVVGINKSGGCRECKRIIDRERKKTGSGTLDV